MSKPPSSALRKIIPPKEQQPLWRRYTPTALERVVTLINSSPLVLFARHKCPHSEQLYKELQRNKLEFRVVYLDDISIGNIMQRRLQDLTGQWTVPNLFAKSQSIGGYNDSVEAMKLGKIKQILDSDEWIELVYAVRPDCWARNAKIKQKSQMSFDMSLQDSHRFAYVHRQRWAKIKRYWGEQPEIEEYPMVHRSRKKKSA